MSLEKTKENWLIKLIKLFRDYTANQVFNSSEKEGANPFLERTIENWLMSVNELGYQMPFSQLLLNEGYSVLHQSKHTAFEQGKDIIALDKKGIPCAFQLKGGNITNARWRAEVKVEVEELIDYKIVHPSVDKDKKHRSYLVTNGELDETVRLAIDNLNSGKWKDAPLIVITRGELLNKFVKLSSNFIPRKVSDYKSFLDLYFSDGRELIDEKQYTNFIKSVLRLNEQNLSKEERRRNITTAILFTSYIISKFKKKDNHIAIIQTLTLLCAYIFALVEKHNLNNKYWLNSFKILWKEIMLTGQFLQEEINQGGLIKLVTSIWDGELGSYRKHLASSYLFAYKIAQLIEGDTNWKDIATNEFFLKLKETLRIWGEASLFSFILVFLYVNKSSAKGDLAELFKPLYTPIEAIIKFNGRKSEVGMLSPYYNITTAIKRKFGLLEEPIDENFARRSFMIKPLIDILARYGKRKELEGYWREITYIEQEDFTPDELWRHFLWRCDIGENKSRFPKQSESWKELAKDAKKIDLNLIPKSIQKHSYFLPFFLLVYPHRINTNYIKFLDEAIQKVS